MKKAIVARRTGVPPVLWSGAAGAGRAGRARRRALTPLAVGGTAGAATPAGATVTLGGELPAVPAGVTRLGAEPGSRILHLTVGLAGQDPAGLAAEVAAVSTPGSPGYHHYLTSAEYAAAYGPDAAEVQQVSTTLRAEGLRWASPRRGAPFCR